MSNVTSVQQAIFNSQGIPSLGDPSTINIPNNGNYYILLYCNRPSVSIPEAITYWTFTASGVGSPMVNLNNTKHRMVNLTGMYILFKSNVFIKH